MDLIGMILIAVIALCMTLGCYSEEQRLPLVQDDEVMSSNADVAFHNTEWKIDNNADDSESMPVHVMLGFSIHPRSLHCEGASPETVMFEVDVVSPNGILADPLDEEPEWISSQIILRDPRGNERRVSLLPNTISLHSMDSNNYHFSVPFTIFPYSDHGMFTIEYALIIDTYGNEALFESSDLKSANIPIDFYVHATDDDSSGPIALSMKFLSSIVHIDLEVGYGSLLLLLEIIDFPAGLARTSDERTPLPHIRFRSVRSPVVLAVSSYIKIESIISGDIEHGIYNVTVQFPPYSTSGPWIVETLFLSDEASNYRVYTTDDLVVLGFDTSFTLVNNSTFRYYGDDIFDYRDDYENEEEDDDILYYG